MDIWIRTQDRKKLIKCSFLKIEPRNGVYVFVGVERGHYETILGEYQSGLTAEKVLDEIQNCIQGKLYLSSDNRVVQRIRTDFVYEMPSLRSENEFNKIIARKY